MLNISINSTEHGCVGQECLQGYKDHSHAVHVVHSDKAVVNGKAVTKRAPLLARMTHVIFSSAQPDPAMFAHRLHL